MEKSGHEKRIASFFRDDLDFAFFAARLGWSIRDYEETTSVQRQLIRKELETLTVETSSLLKNAVQVAVNNAHSKRKAKLWIKRRKKQPPPIPIKEIKALQRHHAEHVPWTPWARKEVQDG